MKRRRHLRLLLLFSLAVVSVPAPIGAASQAAPILFLSGQNGTPRATETIAAFIDTWEKTEPGVRVISQFFAVFSFPLSKQAAEAVRESIVERLRDDPPRLIVAHGDFALDMAADLRKTAFPKTAIVGFEVTRQHAKSYAGAERMRLLPFADFEKNIIALAQRVLPELKTVYILLSFTPQHFDPDEAARRLSDAFPSLEFKFILDPTPARADHALKGAGKRAAALVFSPGWVNEDGRFITGSAYIRDLTRRYPLPFFGLIRDDLDSGLAGGYGVASPDWGSAAAALGLDLVVGAGTGAPTLQTESLARAFLNYAVLDGFGVRIRKLPPTIEIINRPPPLWLRFQTPIQIAIAVMAFALLALILSVIAQRRLDSVLRWANEKLEKQVAERTAALTAANEELSASNENLANALRRAEAMQDTVIRSARESVLGRLAASLANELNSPFNAIASANEASMNVLRDSANGIDRLVGVFDAAQRALFDRYARVVASASFDGSNPHYETARRLEAALEASGCAEAFEVASNLADAGIRDLSPEEAAVFAEEGSRPVAKSLYLLSVIFRSEYIIDQAVRSASNSIAAVRAYASSMKTVDEAGDFDLKASIEHALSLFRDKLGSSYVIEKDLRDHSIVYGDEAAFIRVWTHLIQNALDAMPSGGRLALELREADGGFKVSVADTGSGVRAEIKDRIFEAFVTSKSVEEGLGIGLSYCRRVVEGSGGSIDFETSEAGTVFSVTFPRERKPA